MGNWDESFQRGLGLASKRYYHAAIEFWTELLEAGQMDMEKPGEIYNELGKAYIQVGLAQQARQYFTMAVSCAPDLESRIKYETHLAMTYRRTFEYDKAQRMLTQMMTESVDQLPLRIRALLHANLAVILVLNGFYADGLRNTQASLTYFDSIGVSAYHSTLYNNLGSIYLHLQDYDKAKECLSMVLQSEEGPYLSTISELSRLHMQLGSMEDSMVYAQKALPFVWSSIIDYDKDDVAALCLLLAHLTRFMGEHRTSLRLLEKSQLFFGQLGLWREWQQVQSMMDDWSGARVQTTWMSGQEHFKSIQQFVVLLDALNAQELIHNEFSRLLDTRVLMAKSLASALNTSPVMQNYLIYACRFADYGLATVEPEVVQNPTRSEHSWQQYRLHPSLSIDMLHMAGLPEEVAAIIYNHHERFDGTGYPSKKSGTDIPIMAQVLSVADHYAEAVVMDSKPHSLAMDEILLQSGTTFDPRVVKTFQYLFE